MTFFLGFFTILAVVSYYLIASPSFKHTTKILNFVLIILFLFSAFRYQVGGDWKTYLDGINSIRTSGYNHFKHEPLFYALNLISINFSNYYLMLNFLSALCFFIPLYLAFKQSKLIQGKKNEALIHFLYLIFPVGFTILHIGFIRQGIASSFALLALVYFFDKKYLSMIIAMIIGQGFHVSMIMSASIIFILAIFNIQNLKTRNILVFSLFLLGLLGLYLLTTIRKDYLGGYKSDGLIPRIGYFSLLWGLFVFTFQSINIKKFITYFLLLTIPLWLMSFISILTNTTTVADRFSYYLLFPICFGLAYKITTLDNLFQKKAIVIAHFMYSIAFLVGWFAFSVKSKDWAIINFWFF